ncbi:MAG: DUF3034 family protein [Candidatus Omnitrophota bacterium]|nr:DUF3034 family protein [Candidatus Omnitrophota bacterium]
MRKFTLFAALLLLMVIFSVKNVFAGPPFNNLEGVGGVAFNPLAYLAEGDGDFKIGNQDVIGKPRFGIWYVNLGDPKIDWTAFGVADTLFKRLEVSYGHETVAWVDHPTFHKNNIGAKYLVLPENSFNSKFVPAFSVGTIYKTTSAKGIRKLGYPLRTTGQDWYAVATKTITQLPLPVIVSGGALSSQGFVTGVLGFHDKRKITGFANVDVVLPHGVVVGYEFKQGEQFASYKNANYWNAHVAWLPNKDLTLIAAYTDTGSYTKAGNTRQGLGGGFVLSAQYAF